MNQLFEYIKNHTVQSILTVVLTIVAVVMVVLFLRIQKLTTTPQVPAAETIDVPKITKDDHIRGDAKGRIALVVYTDLECPYCKSFHSTLERILVAYPGIKWIYRHFPLSIHENAQKEAEGAECVSQLGGGDAFWKFIDLIFERTTSNGTGFALEKLGPLVAELGIHQTEFQECVDSGKYEQKIIEEGNTGSDAGITGTPGTVVLDTRTGESQFLDGAVSYEELKAVIDAMLK